MVPFVIIGDEAFALDKNLMRPFPEITLAREKRIFNYRLCRARRSVECAFGVLCNKWRVLHTPLLVNPNFATHIVKAACVLHNYVRRRDGYNYNDQFFDHRLDSVEPESRLQNISTETTVRRIFFFCFEEVEIFTDERYYVRFLPTKTTLLG
ncbi:hypothetical protein EVAR_80264_1 [Eumeta japonica]|uniref:DDE Tnp4 domain-containing protein n=1 Tax=Eumeta variegata TaxID=151549 RepID=A0A4C1UBZ3_EUMVA|nr:hypothetical protein EVAR_80264_1 [Eumeta japonica]